MRRLASAVGAILAVMGLVGIAAPGILHDLGRAVDTPAKLYLFAAVRVLLGAPLLLAPAAARMPRTLRAIGAVMVLAGLATPLFGVARIQDIVSWWAASGPLAARAWAATLVLLGGFIVYAGSAARLRGSLFRDAR